MQADGMKNQRRTIDGSEGELCRVRERAVVYSSTRIKTRPPAFFGSPRKETRSRVNSSKIPEKSAFPGRSGLPGKKGERNRRVLTKGTLVVVVVVLSAARYPDVRGRKVSGRKKSREGGGKGGKPFASGSSSSALVLYATPPRPLRGDNR